MADIRLTRDLTGMGVDDSEIARLLRSGELTRIRRGAYARASTPEADARRAHLALVAATLRLCGPGPVISHMSAAALHGLPIWQDSLDRVALTRDQSGGGRSKGYVSLHGIPLPPSQVTEVDGLPVTTTARTVLDLACATTPFRSVPIGDAALARGLDPTALAELLDRGRGRHGIGVARRAIGMLDGRSESVGESGSRVIFVEHGLPAPVPQFEVHDDLGYLIARVDFGWEEYRTLGEFDGRMKYDGSLAPGQDPREVLWAEKRREDRLRELGWQVVRWVWADCCARQIWFRVCGGRWTAGGGVDRPAALRPVARSSLPVAVFASAARAARSAYGSGLPGVAPSRPGEPAGLIGWGGGNHDDT